MTDKEKSNDQRVDQPTDDATATTTAVAEETVPVVADAEQTPDEQAEPPQDEPPPDDSEDDPHANLAAYLLDALPEDERQAFVEHLATCDVCQEEAASLAPIVGVLPSLLNLDPVTDLQSPEIGATPESLEPSPELRDRILAAIREESAPEMAATEQGIEVVPEVGAAEEAEEVEPLEAEQPAAVTEPTPISGVRPRGRIIPGVTTGPPAVSTRTWQTVSRVSWASRIAAVVSLVAVGAIIWALALQGRVNDLQDENDLQATEIAQAETSSNATVAQLGPTKDGKQDSVGKLIYSLPDQTGWVLIEGMNPLPADQAYQLWYLKDGAAAPAPGPTITVDQNGDGWVQVARDTPSYDGLALTAEPKGGSDAPTSPIVLQGRLSGAAG